MKSIWATWEKTNLNVDAEEIIIESTDTIDMVIDKINSTKANYLVVKLPTYRNDLLFAIQNCGCIYIEDMMTLFNNVKVKKHNKMVDRFNSVVTYKKMDYEAIDELFKKIEAEIFNTDRIYIDPFFSKEQASIRYLNWVKSEIEKGTLFFNLIYKNKRIGFFGLEEKSKGIYVSFLGGIYREHQIGGIGSVIKAPDAVRDLGGTRVYASASSNNLSQIRNLVYNGYEIERCEHIFIKHI